MTTQEWLSGEIKKYIKAQKGKRQISRFLLKDYLENFALVYCLDIEQMRLDIEAAIQFVEHEMKTSFPVGSLFETSVRISRFRENLARKKNHPETTVSNDKNRKLN